jgi:transcriptional regulator with XRE-family HTH domain
VAAADLDEWRAGLMPQAVAQAVLHELERRGVTQDELAAVLGLSRPQLTNGLRRRFGLGDRPTVAVKAWLLEAVA